MINLSFVISCVGIFCVHCINTINILVKIIDLINGKLRLEIKYLQVFDCPL